LSRKRLEEVILTQAEKLPPVEEQVTAIEPAPKQETVITEPEKIEPESSNCRCS